MPSLKPVRHEYSKTVTTRATYVADHIAASDFKESTKEEVTVFFALEDAEDFTRNRSKQLSRPTGMRVKFGSYNGSEWRVEFRSHLQVTNVKKDGSLGADVDLESYDWPEWAKELADTDARDWIKAEYPREAA